MRKQSTRTEGPLPRDVGGFTLMEMVIALTIMGILAAVVVPSLSTTDMRALESAARVLASDLRLARSYAIHNDTDYTIQLDPIADTYDLVHTGSGTPPPIENPFAPAGTAPGTYHVQFARLGSTGDLGQSADLWSSFNKQSYWYTSQITFDPLGRANQSQGGDTVIFIGAGSGRGARFIVVTVSRVTGQVWVGRPQLITAENLQAAFR